MGALRARVSVQNSCVSCRTAAEQRTHHFGAETAVAVDSQPAARLGIIKLILKADQTPLKCHTGLFG
jgi:hypothetical protein